MRCIGKTPAGTNRADRDVALEGISQVSSALIEPSGADPFGDGVSRLGEYFVEAAQGDEMRLGNGSRTQFGIGEMLVDVGVYGPELSELTVGCRIVVVVEFGREQGAQQVNGVRG